MENAEYKEFEPSSGTDFAPTSLLAPDALWRRGGRARRPEEGGFRSLGAAFLHLDSFEQAGSGTYPPNDESGA